MVESILKVVQQKFPEMPENEQRQLAEKIFSQLVRDGWALSQYM